MAAPTFTQRHFRWYADDAALGSGENPLAAEDANPAVYAGTNYRLRIEVANTGGSGSIAGRLEYKQDSGSWTTITGSGNVFYTDSPYFADGDPTTMSLLTAAGTYSAGQAKDAGATSSSVNLDGGKYREWEWNIQFAAGAVGHTYQFRVTNSGSSLTTYTVTPQVAPQTAFQPCTAVCQRRQGD